MFLAAVVGHALIFDTDRARASRGPRGPLRALQGKSADGRITGRITAADTSRGLRGAAVRIIGSGCAFQIVEADGSGAST